MNAHIDAKFQGTLILNRNTTMPFSVTQYLPVVCMHYVHTVVVCDDLAGSRLSPGTTLIIIVVIIIVMDVVIFFFFFFFFDIVIILIFPRI